MNNQGWIRGIMAKNMETKKFITHVMTCLQREFGVLTDNCISGQYIYISLGQHETMITMFEAKNKQARSAYALDKHILEKLKEEGFEFDVMRSQYIMNCYNIY